MSTRCCRMRGSRNRQPAGSAQSHRLEAFLEMLAAERGAARLTIAAYRADLVHLASFLAGRGQALETADAAALHAYFADTGSRRLSPRTVARRLSAMRQFYRFLLGESARKAAVPPRNPVCGGFACFGIGGPALGLGAARSALSAGAWQRRQGATGAAE